MEPEIESEIKQSFNKFEVEQNFLKNPSEIHEDHIFLKNATNISLEDVHRFFKKWLHIKNTNRIDLMLATHLSRKTPGTKIWIIFVGGSGAAKSEILRTLENEDTYILQEITPNTLVSGNPCSIDLAPALNNKTILIMDMAILLNLRKEDKAKVWAQLRELYDGNARKITGSPRGDRNYTGLNITLLACSTGVIDDQILIHQSLGTRELLYRIPPIEEKTEEDALMNKVLENENNEILMRKELKDVIQKFLKGKEYKDIPVPTDIFKELKLMVGYLRIMRASVSLDSYTGDVMATSEPESPTRVLKQFIRIYKSLKALSPNYPDKHALEIINEIKLSSCNLDRVRIYEILKNHQDSDFSITEISQRVNFGKSTVNRHLNVLWNLGLINRIHFDTQFNHEVFKWTINKKHWMNQEIQNKIIVENLSSC